VAHWVNMTQMARRSISVKQESLVADDLRIVLQTAVK
jgi:hypothetical protein